MMAMTTKKWLALISGRLDQFAANRARAGKFSIAVRLWTILNRFRAVTQLDACVRHLMAEGETDAAFRLALAGATMKGRQAASSRQLYEDMCGWLAKAGLALQAEKHIRALEQSQNRANPDHELLVEFWSRRSVLDQRIIPELLLAIQRGSKATLKSALRLLSLIEGPSGRVMELYRQAAYVPGSLVIDHYLSLCATVDPKAFSDFIDATSPESAPFESTLAIDRHIAHADESLRNRVTTPDAIRFALDLEKSNADFWARISDPSVSVAVVGNSPCELGLAKGSLIDSHDIVIRFNMAGTFSDHAKDYGSKTDVLVVNQTVLTQLRDEQKGLLIVTGRDWDLTRPSRSIAAKLLARGFSFALIARDVRDALNQALFASSSSGIQTCAAICARRGGNKNVNFYGFSFVDQIGPEPTSANYFRQSRPASSHNWRGEAQLLQALRQEGTTISAHGLVAAGRYQNHWKREDNFLPTRFFYAGDHSDYHCGSSAVSRHICQQLQRDGVLSEVGDADVIVMNGEGSMHNGKPQFAKKMQYMRSMLDAGKAVYLVNTVWQNNPSDYDDVLQRLSGIQVREVMSQKDLLDRHGIESRLFPDLAYFATLKKARNPVHYHGKIVMTDFYSNEFEAFVKLTRAEALKYPFVDMLSSNWDDLIASLKTAEMLITGRHHGVFAACRAEIPFVAFGGNTHKIEGIFASAKVNIPICKSRRDLAAHILWAKANREEYQKLFGWLKSFPEWRLRV